MTGMVPAPQRERFEIAGSASRPIRGEVQLVRGATRAVVLLHGFKGFYRANFFPLLAGTIAAAGLNVVSFNFSGSGVGADLENFTDAEAFAGNSYGRELYDLSLVLREGDARGWLGDAWGLFGHSRGGGVAILHAALNERVRALATWAAISTVRRWSDADMAAWRARGSIDVANSRTGQVLQIGTRLLNEIERHGTERLDIVRAARQVRCPWLIVHGDDDETVPIDEGLALADAARGAELVRVPGATHGFNVTHGFSAPSPQLTDAIARTVGFFTQQLGGA